MSEDHPPGTTVRKRRGVRHVMANFFQHELRDRADVRDLLHRAHRDGVFGAEELAMFHGVLNVSESQVRDIMIPRSHMVVLERDMASQTLLAEIVRSGHSRFPVLGEDRDEVVGILLAKDLLKYFVSHSGEQIDIDGLLRPAAFIPESKRLNTLLAEFRASHNHMAIVVDEYGGVAGLLTIEDVLEQIVGDIDDEHDPEEAKFIQAEGPDWQVRALTRIEDFNAHFDVELDDENYDTVGGLILHELGRLPRRGETLRFEGFEFRVQRSDRRRIDLLRVTAPAPAANLEPVDE